MGTPAEDQILDMRAETLALRHVLEHLWTSVITNGRPHHDAVLEVRRVAESSLEQLRGIGQRADTPYPQALQCTVDAMLLHEESFWNSVADRIEKLRPPRLS